MKANKGEDDRNGAGGEGAIQPENQLLDLADPLPTFSVFPPAAPRIAGLALRESPCSRAASRRVQTARPFARSHRRHAAQDGRVCCRSGVLRNELQISFGYID